MTLCIFDGYGKLRSDLDTEQAAIEALPDDQRETLFACIKAITASDAGEARVIAARADVRTKEATYYCTTAAYNNVMPSRDTVTGLADHSPRAEANTNPAVKNAQRVAAARAVSAAQQPGYVPAKPTENKFKSALDKAEADLAEARAALSRATTEHRKLERLAGEAINAWRGYLPVMSRDTLMKEHVAKGLADRMARVARGESPEPPKIVPQYQSELDRIRGSGKPKVRPLIVGR